MAIGMTLNQLYAPPPSSSSAGSAPASSSSSVSAPLTPPQGRSPKDDVKSGLQLPPQPQPQMDRVYQMPPYSQQPFNPAGYPSTSVSSSSATQYQPLAKPGPSTSEDYAADPIPFEYSRKYTRDDASSGLQRAATIVTSSSYADSYGSHPVYAQSQQQQRLSPYAQQQQPPAPQYPEPRSYHHDPMQPQFPTRPATSQIYAPMPGSMLPLPNHPFPPLLDVTKKEVDAYPQTQYADVRAPMSSPSGTAQEAMIKVKTPLKLKYWRNGRRNLQCFPSCKVFGDYSAIKIEDLKQHDFMWGKCRGSLVTEVTLNSNVTFDDLVLLGRVHSLENIPVAFEEAVIRECMLGRTVETDEMDAMKDQWITGERLPDFVQQDGNVACFEFKPKVWKYTEDMAQGKCKRRNVKYYVQFEAFVQMAAGDRRYYACIGSGMSTSFEVGSSRVLARQKRKAATSAADAAKKNPQGDMVALQPQQLMAHNGNALLHSVMATHPMSNPMYVQPPPSYSQHHDGQTRGLPPTFPHPQVMMNQMPPQQQMPPEMHYPMPQQQQQQLQPPPMQQQQQTQAQSSVGEKRKMNSERPAFPTDRASKMLKPMSGVPQSVPI